MLIIALGSGFRLHGLRIQSLWNDELASWSMSNRENLQAVIMEEVAPDVHPPGYQMLLFVSMKLFGDSELALRLPSAFAGMLSIAAIYILGKRLYSAREGLIAALLCALLVTPVAYSQEARAYAFVILLTIVSSYWWVRLNASTEHRRWLSAAAYGVAAILLAYMHYFGLLMVLLQGAAMFVLVLRQRQGWFKFFTVYAIIGVAYLPWLPTFLWQMQNRQTGNTNTGALLPPPEPAAIWGYMRFLFNNLDWLVVLALVLYAFLLVRDVHRTPRFNVDVMLSTWLVLPLVLVYILSWVRAPVFTNRNLLILMPAAYLLLARAIMLLPGVESQPFAVVVFLCLILVALLLRSGYYTSNHKEQFREAVNIVAENTDRYPDAVIVASVWSLSLLAYYETRAGLTPGADLMAGWDSDIPAVEQLVDERQPDYIWYVRANRIPQNGFWAYFTSHFDLLRHWPLVGADVVLFSRQ